MFKINYCSSAVLDWLELNHSNILGLESIMPTTQAHMSTFSSWFILSKIYWQIYFIYLFVQSNIYVRKAWGKKVGAASTPRQLVIRTLFKGPAVILAAIGFELTSFWDMGTDP